MWGKILICLIIGYCFGCIQTGYFYGKSKGIDIRTKGSGNAGTTNTLRILGKKAGYITFAGDALKAVAAVCIVKYLLFANLGDTTQVLAMYAGLGVVLGHNFPFYLKFKGGKGIAATAGVMLAFNPWIAIIAGGLFFIIFFATRYVSLGSLVLSLCFPICILIFYPGQLHLLVLAIIFWLMAWWRHRANIQRLLNGTENRFDKKQK